VTRLQVLPWIRALWLSGVMASFAIAGSTQEVLPRWVVELHPDAHQVRRVPVLTRQASQQPAALRLVVLVGSGCAGMGPLADVYFRGLSATEIWIIHKPHTSPWVRRAPDSCTDEFLRYDRHSSWQADAASALDALRDSSIAKPTWIVGISEGGEIVPMLARALGEELQGIVLLSAPGLDPWETMRLQARRLGRMDAWSAIERASRSAQNDHSILHGRSLGYWRDLMSWSVSQPLLQTDWTILQVWGDQDELVPPAAYERFQALAKGMGARVCSIRWPRSDHGLTSAVRGSAQSHIWRLVENWSQDPLNNCLQGHLASTQPRKKRPAAL